MKPYAALISSLSAALMIFLSVRIVSAVPLASQWRVDNLGQIQVREGRSFTAAFSSDGRFIALGGPGGFSVYDVDAGTEQWTYATDLTIQSLAWSQDGMSVAAGTSDAEYPDGNSLRMVGGFGDGTVVLFNAVDGEEQWSLPINPSGAIFDLAFSPDGTHLVYASPQTAELVMLDVSNGEAVADFSGVNLGMSLSVAWSSDGTQVAGGYDVDDTYIWDVESSVLLPAASAEWRGILGGVVRLTFSPDGRLVASGALADPLYIFDTESGELIQVLQDILEPGSGTRALTFSPDGLLLAAANDSGVVMWDTQTWEQVAIIGVSASIALSFTPENGHLLVATRGGVVHEYDVSQDSN